MPCLPFWGATRCWRAWPRWAEAGSRRKKAPPKTTTIEVISRGIQRRGPTLNFRPAQARAMSHSVLITLHLFAAFIDRKSAVSRQSVSVRVDLGGRRIIKTTQNYTLERWKHIQTAAKHNTITYLHTQKI